MPEVEPAAVLPPPPKELRAHSRRLQDRVRRCVQAGGFLPFMDYMEMALYEPGLGYYSAGLHKFGAQGDFITAPGLGKVFAGCLARHTAALGRGLGDYEVLEVGAGDGRLATELLRALDPAELPRRYAILERSADLRAVQQAALAELPDDRAARVEWLDAPPEKEWQGVLLANEVLDALAVEAIETRAGTWWQRGLVLEDGALAWSRRPAPPELDRLARSRLDPGSVEAGYRTEICTLLPGWLDSVTRQMSRGCALFIDYGYTRSEYYHADRHRGTLICQYRHRTHEDPLFWPGLQDITAFVDFTALAEAGAALGLECGGFATQANFLINCGLASVAGDIQSMEDKARYTLAQEVRALTLPDGMGERFQCMALTRGWQGMVPGFENGDRRDRL